MYSWTRLAAIRRVAIEKARIPHHIVSLSTTSTDPPNHAVSTARSTVSNLESLIGYPTPLLSLRHLLFGGELSCLSVHFKRLFSSCHPIVEQSRLLIDRHTKLTHTQGMLTLLTAKCLNLLNTYSPQLDQFGILPSQRSIGEVTEMINIAHMIHNEVVDLPGREEELSFGNKMIILGGDILLARACKELSLLYNPEVVGVMSQGISILMESSFEANNDSKGRGSLLGKSCQSCAVLGQLSSEWIELALQFGNHLSVIHQLSMQRQSQSTVHFELYDHHSSLALNMLEEFPDSTSRTALEEFIVYSFNNNVNDN